jgi:hypothetical protein
MSRFGDSRTFPTSYVIDGNLDISDREDSASDRAPGFDDNEPPPNAPIPVEDDLPFDKTEVVFPPNIHISAYSELKEYLKRFKTLSKAFLDAFRKFSFL